MDSRKVYEKRATRTGNHFKKRTNSGSRERKTEENDREKTNQTGIKDERTCFAWGTKGHKIKDRDSKRNNFITYRENLDTQNWRE